MEFNSEKYDLIQLVISREEIESFDHIRILKTLEEMKANALKFEGKLNILIHGYDDDPRELYEIAEIRAYVDFLDRSFPYWFFFLTKKIKKPLSPFVTLISLLVPYTSILQKSAESRLVQFDEQALHEFINIHFHFLNELTDELNISLEENKRISKEVIDNIF